MITKAESGDRQNVFLAAMRGEDFLIDMGELEWVEEVFGAMEKSLTRSKWEDREEYRAALSVGAPLVRAFIIHLRNMRDVV